MHFESLKKYGSNLVTQWILLWWRRSKLDEAKEGKAVDPSHYRGSKHIASRFSFIKEAVENGNSWKSQLDQIALDDALVLLLTRLKQHWKTNTSHAVAANLSELELKKILIDKMEANNSINRSDIQRQLYKLVEAYEADKILLDHCDTITIKRPRDGADDDQEPSLNRSGGNTKPEQKGSKLTQKSLRQSAPVEEAMQTTDVFEAPAHQEFETGVHDEQAEEEVQHLPDWFQQPTRLPSPDHAWNKSVPAVHESVQNHA
ncbi:hypothetical protein Tco_0099362 [Tanacetum coccineum]